MKPDSPFTPSYINNITRLFVYTVLANSMLFLPVWVIFLQVERGLTLAQVTVTDVAYWLTMVLVGLLAGALADIRGRKFTLTLSITMSAISLLLFALAPTFLLLMIANSMWAASSMLGMGAEVALLYESLKMTGQAANYTRLRGQFTAFAFGSVALSSILGGLIGETNLQLPFFISSSLWLLASLVLLGIKEPPPEADGNSGEKSSYTKTILKTLSLLRSQINLRFALLYSAFLPLSVSMVIVLFLQPYALSIGLPIAILGMLSSGLQGVRMLGSASAARLEEILGEWRLFRLAPLLAAAGLVILGLLHHWSGILLFALSCYAMAAARPTLEKVILRYSPGEVRASIFSVDMMISRIFLIIIEPLAGLFGDRFGLSPLFVLLGVFTLAVLYLLLLGWRKVWQPNYAI